MSTGAKAGIAIGIIAVIGVLAVLLLWLLGKKKKEREAQANKDNEKSAYTAGAPPATEMVNRSPTVSSAIAPRLSLRPVSRMLPEFTQPSRGRLSGGNLLKTVGESGPASARNLSPSPQPRGPSPTPRPTQRENPFADPQNPFADPEKPLAAPVHAAPTHFAVSTPPAGPTPVAPIVAAAGASTADAVASQAGSDPIPTPAQIQAPAPAPEATSALAAEPAIVAVPGPQAAPKEAPPSTPVAAVAGAAAANASPANEQSQGNVYRVLMDFAPSMDDELELKNGQLVRMLHEYDDGWVSSP